MIKDCLAREYFLHTKNKWYASSKWPHEHIGSSTMLHLCKSDFRIQLCLSFVWIMFKNLLPKYKLYNVCLLIKNIMKQKTKNKKGDWTLFA